MKQAPTPAAEPVHDILHGRGHPLDIFFAPRTVAVIGATDKPASVGRTILWNLLSNPFGGIVFPINPRHDAVLGIKAYPNIAEAPAAVDLAIIVTPAPTVPAVVAECAESGVKGAIIISAGFREVGPAGAELEAEILANARRGRMRVIGPNCLGLMSPLTGLNATFAGAMARPGNVAFISQSGALCTAILDWSLREFVGFSAFISIGSMVDVGWGDVIDYLGDDPRTRSIILYMESIGNPRSFLSAARQVALNKPIIVIKAGRTEAAARAAASHTGALAGSDEVLDAAFRRVGVLRVGHISDLFYMAEVLAKQPRPKGPRLAILTNAGGPGVLATDALISEGGELAALAPETVARLDQLLPHHWSGGNPVDILGDATADRYAKAAEIVSKDPDSDGLLVILAPQGMADPTSVAEELKPYAKLDGKPILASFMGGTQVAAAEAILNRANIPTFSYPDTAARAFQYMWRFSYNLRGLYETPQLVAGAAEGSVARATAAKLLEDARRTGRTLLTELESKQLLQAYGIPIVETRPASTEDEAARLASEIGYPVVLKLLSEAVTHKTDVGGVRLNLSGAAAVRQAYRAIEASVREKAGATAFLGVTVQTMVKLQGYEIIIGSTLDPQFGPVLLFGAGGELVEVFRDRALALPPLNTTLARRMMEQTRIFKALQGTRGRKPVDLAALEQLLVRFSELVLEHPAIKEIDVNPLLVSADGIIALDARVLVHDSAISGDDLPRPSIRPYPSQYAAPWTLKDATAVMIRPIRPEDEPLMVEFHRALSDRSVYLRYLHTVSLDYRVAHERLTRICFVDYDREMVLVAEHRAGEGRAAEIAAVGRLTRQAGSDEAETAILVRDSYQNRGLGTELVRRLIEVARAEKIRCVSAETLAENVEMQQICHKLGFELRRAPDDPSMVRAVLKL
ncbi:MAG TPA: bifunctional acetate--CoA ligase family protein/GNAT family N-acetyltransferase [Terriglobia bacterium]|nr:bifunctional acetate--CoA ligase family protein/GNAT family N-acetyltransferase [Terriglobia bacterium]